jgi:hypothetical protein
MMRCHKHIFIVLTNIDCEGSATTPTYYHMDIYCHRIILHTDRMIRYEYYAYLNNILLRRCKMQFVIFPFCSALRKMHKNSEKQCILRTFAEQCTSLVANIYHEKRCRIYFRFFYKTVIDENYL